jgi:hypothetical protein
MFTPNTVIDTVQNAKKQIVETFVSDKEIRKGLVEIIEAQTAFVKTATQNTIDITKMMIESYGKVDYSKYFAK